MKKNCFHVMSMTGSTVTDGIYCGDCGHKMTEKNIKSFWVYADIKHRALDRYLAKTLK